MSATALVGALRVMLGLDSVAFEAGADEAQRRMKRFEKQMNRVSANLTAAGQKLSLAVTLPLIGLFAQGVQGARAQQEAIAAVDAVLASMGQGAGFTRDQLVGMADALAGKTLFEDDEILTKVTANLLTFGNVSGEVFTRAQALALDLSARLGTDLQGSAIMLGKALENPTKGVAALAEVGVSFTEQQRDQIAAMMEAGDVAGAQGIILAELERQYRGQAEALAQTDSGKITQAWKQIGEAVEKVGEILLPRLAEIAESVSKLADWFADLPPPVQDFAVAGLLAAAAVGPLLIGLGWLAGVVTKLAPLLLLVASPVGLLVIGVGLLTYVVWKNWDAIKEWAGSIAEAGVELGQKLLDKVTNAAKALKGWAQDTARDMMQKLKVGIEDGVHIIQQTFTELWNKIATMIKEWPAKFVELGADLVEGLKQGIIAQWDALVSWFDAKMQGLIDSAKGIFGIQSPSRVFAEIGRFLMAGLGLGITAGTAGAVGSMTDATGAVVGAVADMGADTESVFKEMGGWLADLAKGATTLAESLSGVLSDWSSQLMTSGTQGLQASVTASLGPVVGGLLGGLMGFADGGSFQVGGVGGIDSQVVAFRASPNERVTITTPEQEFAGMGSGGGGAMDVRVFVDQDGNWQAKVAGIAGQVAAGAMTGAAATAHQAQRRR